MAQQAKYRVVEWGLDGKFTVLSEYAALATAQRAWELRAQRGGRFAFQEFRRGVWWTDPFIGTKRRESDVTIPKNAKGQAIANLVEKKRMSPELVARLQASRKPPE